MDKFIVKKSKCGKDWSGVHLGKNVCESGTFGAMTSKMDTAEKAKKK
jgi:hypothetical protein